MNWWMNLIAYLLGVSSEEKQTRGEPVEAVDGPEVLEALLLGQDEHNSVVPVSPAGVHL